MQTLSLKKTSLIISVLVGLFAVLSFADPAAAIFEGSKGAACKGANLDGTNANCKEKEAAGTLENTIKNVINVLSLVVGIVAVVMIIVNGFKFITSAGDSNAITSARNGIIYAAVGLIVVALAQVFVRFVIGKAT